MHAGRTFAIAVLVLIMGASAVNGTPASTELQRIYAVESVRVRTIEAPSPRLQIEASGISRTGGWTQPTLRPLKERAPGMLRFEFLAKPPEGIATQALTPVKTTTTIPKPAGYQGIVVLSETNRQEAS